MTTPRAWSSVCSSRITSAVTTERPASIIVANWREKTCSDFGCTFFSNIPDFFLSVPAALLISAMRSASRPPLSRTSRAEDRSAAWISPVSSFPWALIAL